MRRHAGIPRRVDVERRLEDALPTALGGDVGLPGEVGEDDARHSPEQQRRRRSKVLDAGVRGRGEGFDADRDIARRAVVDDVRMPSVVLGEVVSQSAGQHARRPPDGITGDFCD